MFQDALLLATVKRGLSFTLGKYLNMNGSVRQGMAACAQPSGGGDIIILPKYQQQVWEIISLHLIISRYGEVVTGWSSTGWPWAGEGGERGGKGGGVNNIYGTILFRQENNILPPSLPGQGLEISLTPNCLLYRLYLYWDSVMRKTELIFLSNFIKNLQNARFIPYKYTSKLIS